MLEKDLSIKNCAATCFEALKNEKSLLVTILIYGIVASAFNLFLPLSIQYIGSQITANPSIFPIITIISFLLAFLICYGILKIIQILAFSHFEKRFFIKTVEIITNNSTENSSESEQYYQYDNILFNNNKSSSNETLDTARQEIKKIKKVQSYAEISNIIKYVANFVFSTSFLIQQILIGLVLTAFYHIYFLIFNIVLLLAIFVLFKAYFLPSVLLHKRELDIKYRIGSRLFSSHEDQDNRPDDVEKLLVEYSSRKNRYFAIILQQNVFFFLLYILANSGFLAMSSILTLNGHITIPQFLASELIFSLVFMNLGDFAKNLKNIYELCTSSQKLNIITNVYRNKNSTANNISIGKTMTAPRFYVILLKFILAFFIIITISLFIVPWWQTSSGEGAVIAYNQDDRIQDINSLVSGRIAKWYANDGTMLKKGDKIAEIVDNDPELVEKLQNELSSINNQYLNAKLSAETAKININRQEELYKQGLVAKKEVEKTKIEYQKLLSYENEVKAKLTQTDIKFSRQKAQIITAPKNGFLFQVKSKSNASYIYAGEKIATFVPTIKEPAIEIYIKPNDIPLIHIGKKARIQIEGWPALRIPGWPSTSLGTFAAVVSVVDQAISANGKFRVILVPDKNSAPWPNVSYIKQGTKIKGWITMNKVSIGYELWRQINGFPIAPDDFSLKDQATSLEKQDETK